MSWPLVCIDLDERSRDFQRIALQPGFPLLDRFSANAGILRQWIGRFAADAVWDDHAVRFLYRDDQDNSAPTDIAPATLSDLQGPLKQEVDALQSRFFNATPKSANERTLLKILKERLDQCLAGSTIASGCFFKVRVHKRWRLVWCWGYERRHSKSDALGICSNQACRLAFFDDSETRHQCPRCKSKLRARRSLWGSAAIALSVLVLAGIGFWIWDQAGRPGLPDTTIQGLVVDSVTGKPVANASVQSVSAAKSLAQSDEHGEFTLSFRNNRDQLEVSAPGYRSVKLSPSESPGTRQRVPLLGESEVAGLVVQEGTDHPIPFPVIRSVQTEHRVTGDELGLFHIPGIPSGSGEFEVSAEGYHPLTVQQELKPGRSPDLLFSLKGAAAVTGTVIDAYNKQPVAAAVIRVAQHSGESVADEQGAFRLDDLPGTMCQFEISAPNYFRREYERQLAPNGETKLRFLLNPELSSLEGTITDSSGAGLPSANVRVAGSEFPVKASAKGQFRLNGVRKGTQQLEVSAEGYPSRMVDVTVPSPDKSMAPIPLSGSGKLVGRIVDAVSKSPIKGAEIRLDKGRWKTTSDAQGQFEIADLPNRSSSIEVVGPGYGAVQSEVMLSGDETKADFELRGSNILRGTVKSAFNQRPLAGATVELRGGGSQITDSEGGFRFENVVAGPARLTATAEHYRTATKECETRADQETAIEVVLSGTAKLEGKVISADANQPISEAVITASGTNQKLVTNDRGEFSQEDWPAALMRLNIAATGFVPQQLDCDLSSTSARQLAIRLKRSHTIRGIVVDDRTEKPVVAASVAMPGSSGSIATDAQGRFSFEASEADSYEFDVASAGYPRQSFVERPVNTEPSASDAGIRQKHSDLQNALITLRLKPDSENAVVHPEPDEPTRDSFDEPLGKVASPSRNSEDVEFFGIRTKAANIGFAIDSSGSMVGNRTKRTKLECLNSIVDLNPNQKYYVAFFSNDTHKMFGSEESPVAASPVNKVRTYKWMESIHAHGGTMPQTTIEMLSEMNPNSIFLLSDGVFDPFPDSLYAQLLQKGIRVNTIAFEDQSGADGLSTIAQRTNGQYRFVPKADISPLAKSAIMTRLYGNLLGQWLDPVANEGEAQAAHEGLVELCDGHDLGPQDRSDEASRTQALDDWRRWWVEHTLVPQLASQNEINPRKFLDGEDLWWRWAALETLRSHLSANGNLVIAKVKDSQDCIRQAARRMLKESAGGDDFGPQEDAASDAILEAFENWTDWWRRNQYLVAIRQKPDNTLVNDFSSSDVRARRVSLQTAAGREKFPYPNLLIARLADDDQQVREAAVAALVKTTGQDLSPDDCSDLESCQTAAKNWREWLNNKTENEAEKSMRIAESFDRNGRRHAAQQWYKKIIKKFPGTDVAERASAKLNASGQ